MSIGKDDLDQQLQDISAEVDRDLTEQRSAHEKLRYQLSQLKAEISSTTNKNDRETLNLQRERKTLKRLETGIEGVENERSKYAPDSVNMLQWAKQK